MKTTICTIGGFLGSIISLLFGGWSQALTTLVIFMIIDYVLGLTVAGVFHQSKKTSDGKLESRAGWKGLCRKVATLILVAVTYRIDLLIIANGYPAFVENTVAIGFIINETISILENSELMGIPIPKAVHKALHMIEEKTEQKVGDEEC